MARTTEHRWNGSHWFNRGPAAGAFLTLLALALLLSALLSRYESVLLFRSKSDAGALLAPHCNALNLAIANRLSLLHGLRAFVETEQYEAGTAMAFDFPNFAAVLCEGVKGLRNVSISPGGVQRYVFPLKGNLKALGLDLLQDKRPGVSESIRRALDTGKVVLTGPYELATGGLGFVGRLALFKGNAFWGMVSTAVELPPLMESSGFNNLPGQYTFAIRRQNGEVFFGQGAVFENNPVVGQVHLPGESWEVGVHPINGWHSAVRSALLPVEAAGVVVVLLLSCIVYLVGNRHVSLAGAVKTRTEELAASEELFRTLFQASPLGIISLETEGIVTSWNHAAERIYGWKARDVIGKFLPTLPSERVGEFEQISRRVLAEGALSGLELVRERKDGSRIDISVSVAPFRKRGGRGDGIIAIIEDITERKKSERELRESRTRMRLRNVIAGDRLDAASVEENVARAVKEIGLAFGRYHVGYLIVDSHGHIEIVSSFEPEGMPEFQKFESDSSPVPWYLNELLENKVVIIPDVMRDLLSSPLDRFPGGEWTRAVLAAPAMLWDDLTGVLCMVSGEPRQWSEHEIVTLQEVSDDLAAVSKEAQARKQQAELQAQLIQSQKIDSIGCLAGGVAHDFNNLLMPIIAYSEMILTEIGAQHPFYQRLHQINQAGEKAKNLTHQLLAFGRKQQMDVKFVDLNTVVSDFEGMLQRLIGEDVRVETSLSTEIGSFKGDVAQIEQVLLNLAVNARDAMPGGGLLKIETSKAFLDKEQVKARVGVFSGRYVMLAVSDSGSGMDHETQNRIFEPFYTTKEKGKGTGLGLSTVHGIVKQHEGHIFVYSEQGKGTTFKVYFPAAQAEVNAPAPAQKPAICPGTETIMVVEDDETVRALTVTILSRCGYRMLVASRPQEAINIAREHNERIDLILTDVIMPGMNGRDLYRRIQSLRPGTKALFMSGYTADIIGQHGILDQDIHFISKPFAMQSLSRKIREVLDESVPAGTD